METAAGGDGQRVVFYGDSRAAPRIAGLQCIPCGFPGASAGYVLGWLAATLGPLRPDAVMVQASVNDLVEGYGAAPVMRLVTRISGQAMRDMISEKDVEVPDEAF